MALDSAAALAILCHILGELWDAEWRESLSERESIIAYACTGREEGQGGHGPVVRIWAWTRATAILNFSWKKKKRSQNALGKNHCQPFHWHFGLTNSNNNFCFHLASHSSEKPLIVDKGPESPLPSDFWHRRLFFFKSLRNYPFGWYSVSPNTMVSFVDLFYGHILQFLKRESFKGAKKIHFNQR